MHTQPYKTISFDWLENDHPVGAVLRPGDEDVEQEEYSLPNDYGKGWFQTLRLALGMTMFRSVQRFEPSARGRSIPFGNIKVELNEPTFQAQVLRGGQVLETQIYPAGNFLLSPGIDLFRYSEGYQIAPSLDGSCDSEMTCLSIGHVMLENLIGSQDTKCLLDFLCITPLPQVSVKAIPLHISAHLHGSINLSLIGFARKLYCQARALDYLTALVEYMKSVTGTGSGVGIGTDRRRSRDIHEYLMGIDGKLPTLDMLAIQFGCSARLLNEEFHTEYGESIYSFITGQRLVAAHEVILKSDLALKVLSSRLGYAHVNHFITAFRRKFGYPPGSLRKQKSRGVAIS